MSDAPRIERDPAFWIDVASHPAVSRQMLGLRADDLAAHVCNPRVLPVRGEHGGYLFVLLDALGRTYDVHALFRPEGWGREAAAVFKTALRFLFEGGAQILTVHEVGENWRSRPPASYGFAHCGPMADSLIGPVRTWALTAIAWRASPAYRRMTRCRQF